MSSDSVWNISALLTRITHQVSRTFDLNASDKNTPAVWMFDQITGVFFYVLN